MPRGQKPAITPKQAEELLRRVEERGESIISLAKDKSVAVSVRTLERAFQRVRDRRDQSRATHQFLTDRLARHHDALVSFAEELRTDLMKHGPGPVSPSLKTNALWVALRQHVPQSLLWRDLNDWEKLGPARDAAKANLLEKIRSEVSQATGLAIANEDERGLRRNFQDDLTSDLDLLVSAGSRAERDFVEEPHPKGVLVKRGAYNLAVVVAKDKERFKKAYRKVVAAASQWPEFEAIRPLTDQERRLRDNLVRSLTGIVLKGMVPGKCRYCPF